MIALIQAGGAGTRLKSITGDLPKPMVRICEKPILQWQIESMMSSGIKEFILIVSCKSKAVQEYFGDGSNFDCKISYIVEESPLGSGGALALVSKAIKEDFILCFGDLMLDVDWKRFMSFHKKKNAIITAFTHPNSHPYDSDVLVADSSGKIINILPKNQERDFFYANLTNAGLYCVSPTLLETFEDEPVKMDFEKDLLIPTVACEGAYAYRSSEYVKDAGTPGRYETVINDCSKGIISAKCLKNPQKAIFLDRDGTINVFGNFVTDPSGLKLIPQAPEAIKRINGSSYLAICVTNQPVVARGETTFEGLHQIHCKMEDLLGNEGAYLDDIFFCPHHPDKGFPGEVPSLKIDCDCRKPKIGMLLKAKEKYNIDLASSWFIGDTCQDVQTGINAGCKTILLLGGDPRPYAKYGDAKPDYVCKTIDEAVDYILSKEN